MSSGAITKNSDTHLACAFAELLLVWDISGGINTINAVAVVICTNILIMTSREDRIVSIITIFATPVVSSKRTISRE